MSDKKLVIISVDALNAKDYDYIKTLPTFKRFLDEGAHVKDVASVYPTVTYTCHTSIVTGHYPHTHKVYNNEFPQPHKATRQDWRWFESDIKSPTLFDYARQHNYSIATLLWPVMGDADVQWNVPELWSPDDSVSGFRLFWRHGTKNMLMPVLRCSHLLDAKKQPQLDNFTEAISAFVLKNKQPDITAIHFTELDLIRHIHGLDSSEAYSSLKHIDQRIAHLLAITKKNGTYKNTNFILLGDHGTHDFSNVIEINSYFLERNFLSIDKEGRIDSWKAYSCTCGGSCQIHVSKDITKEVHQQVYNALIDLINQPDSPVKSILTKQEALTRYQLSGDFEWVLEAQDRHIFKNSTSNQLLTNREDIPGSYKGDHGYLPEHPDMRTLLLMMGPDIVKGATLEHCSLVDEGPTFAHLMGMTMEKTDGRVLTEMVMAHE